VRNRKTDWHTTTA